MAGIGEASAIIAVAQAGISLSMVIVAYVGDVRDAPKSISRIGNEIKSTSGRLEEIAEIIRDNPKTKLLLDTAVEDATRRSSECELILAQVGNLLVRGGWKRDSTGLSKNDIDTSVVASLRWPFLKTRLDTPRVELQGIKADLILLFNVAMARKSSTPLTNEYARKIPLLIKKKEEAARRAEEARHQARDHDDGTRTRSPRAPSRRGPQIAEEDPELSQQFWESELERAKEQDDLRIQERAALLQAENNTRQRLEEDRQREIARKAIEDYKLQQEELKARIMAREKQLSDELLALGLGPEQVASVLAIPSLEVDEIRSNAISRRRSTESQHTSLSEVARKSKPQRKRLSDFANRFLSWRGNHSSRSYDSGNYEDLIELWLVDVFSRQHTELAPSERWMSQKLERIERSNDVWHRFAQLQPIYRIAIQDFLEARNKAQTPEHAWRLIHIGLPRRMMKMGFFGHNHQGQLVRLIISRRKAANQGVNGVFVKGEQERTSQSTVRAEEYQIKQLEEKAKKEKEKKEADEEFRERVKKTFGQAGYTEESIEKILKKGEKGKGHGHGKEIKIKDLTRPTYIIVHRKHVSPETLDEYNLPWEWDEHDSNYIVIKRWIPETDQEILFDHTKKLRERKMITDSTVELRRERDNLLLVRKKSPERSSRSLAPPTLSNAFDSLDKPWHKYENFSSRPPKTFPSSRVTTQSRARAPKSVDSSDDEEEDRDSSGPAKGEIGDDADLIAKTLSRYTTFKIGEDATAGAKSSAVPTEDAPISPTTSRSRSSTPPRYPSTLEEMKSSLEKMRIKQSRAEEEGDLATSSDLRYHAIPEIEWRIKEKEDESRTRAEEAEDKIASASNATKRTPNALRLARIQRRGILDDSPTKEQPDRSGERTSHSLKKRKSTDDLRNEDLADPSIHSADSANHVSDHAARATREEIDERDSSHERLANQRPRITEFIVPRLNRSPSESGSERSPVRRADTQLYEADSEGSGGEEAVFERRDRWRRPIVEEEIIETVSRRPTVEDEIIVEEE